MAHPSTPRQQADVPTTHNLMQLTAGERLSNVCDNNICPFCKRNCTSSHVYDEKLEKILAALLRTEITKGSVKICADCNRTLLFNKQTFSILENLSIYNNVFSPNQENALAVRFLANLKTLELRWHCLICNKTALDIRTHQRECWPNQGNSTATHRASVQEKQNQDAGTSSSTHNYDSKQSTTSTPEQARANKNNKNTMLVQLRLENDGGIKRARFRNQQPVDENNNAEISKTFPNESRKINEHGDNVQTRKDVSHAPTNATSNNCIEILDSDLVSSAIKKARDQYDGKNHTTLGNTVIRKIRPAGGNNIFSNTEYPGKQFVQRSPISDFPCHRCGKSFKNKQTLSKHLNSSKCPFCKAVFCSVKQFQVHLHVKHPAPSTSRDSFSDDLTRKRHADHELLNSLYPQVILETSSSSSPRVAADQTRVRGNAVAEDAQILERQTSTNCVDDRLREIVAQRRRLSAVDQSSTSAGITADDDRAKQDMEALLDFLSNAFDVDRPGQNN